MLVIPAIDLKDGQCVRLRQGEIDDATVFSDEPINIACLWREQGARRLHLVDLNGAFAGEPKNLGMIRDILEEVSADLPVQLGGGIRDLQTIERYLKVGLSYVIIGTAAVTDPSLVKEACQEFPGKVLVGLDAKEGDVAINGWAQLTGQNVIDVAQQLQESGCSGVIYTDIGRDGMLSGVNVEATVKLAQALTIPVIASGGVSNLEDIRALSAVEEKGIIGAITGRAIYEGTLDFREAQLLADALTKAKQG